VGYGFPLHGNWLEEFDSLGLQKCLSNRAFLENGITVEELLERIKVWDLKY